MLVCSIFILSPTVSKALQFVVYLSYEGFLVKDLKLLKIIDYLLNHFLSFVNLDFWGEQKIKVYNVKIIWSLFFMRHSVSNISHLCLNTTAYFS